MKKQTYTLPETNLREKIIDVRFKNGDILTIFPKEVKEFDLVFEEELIPCEDGWNRKIKSGRITFKYDPDLHARANFFYDSSSLFHVIGRDDINDSLVFARINHCPDIADLVFFDEDFNTEQIFVPYECDEEPVWPNYKKGEDLFGDDDDDDLFDDDDDDDYLFDDDDDDLFDDDDDDDDDLFYDDLFDDDDDCEFHDPDQTFDVEFVEYDDDNDDEDEEDEEDDDVLLDCVKREPFTFGDPDAPEKVKRLESQIDSLINSFGPSRAEAVKLVFADRSVKEDERIERAMKILFHGSSVKYVIDRSIFHVAPRVERGKDRTITIIFGDTE